MTTFLFNDLKPISLASANEMQTSVLEKAQKQVGFIPNMYSNMVNMPAYLDTYLHGYNLFRSESELSPAEQEVVFLAISISNNCDYCLAAHSTLAAKYSEVPESVLNAIRCGEVIADEKLAALYAVAFEVSESRGKPNASIVNKFLALGYSERHLLAITLAVSVKVLSNYSNHMFNTNVDEVFADYR